MKNIRIKANEEQIIGHFGLGFYSAFMVADRSYNRYIIMERGCDVLYTGSQKAVSISEMSEGDKSEIGTTITLSIRRTVLNLQTRYRVREVLTKYCSFMPVEIFLSKKEPSRNMRQ